MIWHRHWLVRLNRRERHEAVKFRSECCLEATFSRAKRALVNSCHAEPDTWRGDHQSLWGLPTLFLECPYGRHAADHESTDWVTERPYFCRSSPPLLFS